MTNPAFLPSAFPRQGGVSSVVFQEESVKLTPKPLGLWRWWRIWGDSVESSPDTVLSGAFHLY